MNAYFVSIINRIVDTRGEAILGEPARLKGFIRREAAGIPTELRRAFGRCIEQGCYRALKQTPDAANRARIKPQIARQVHNVCKLDYALCTEAVDILEAVIYNTARAPQPAPQGALPQTPAPPRTPLRAPLLARWKRPSQKTIIALSATAAALGILLFALLHSGVSAFEPIIEFNGEEYPSKIIAVAATDSVLGGGPRMIENDGYIGDALGDLGVKLRLRLPDKTVRVEIEGDRFVKKSSLETQITTKKSVEIFPRINYNWAELEKIEEPYIENITFKLYIDDKLKKEAVEAVPFHGIQDEPLWDASRNGNKTLSNYHFVVVIREMERIERELEKQRLAAEQREAARLEAERARLASRKDPYNDKRIRDTIAKVHANLRDVNGDGQTNCVDYSNLFFYYSPFKYNDVVVNYNPKGPQGGMNHQFNVVQIDGQFVYIEPQASGNRSYDLQEFWGAKYNPAYNQIHKTNWLYLPRGQAGTEE